MGVERPYYRMLHDKILPLVINEDIYMELLELLELYCELLLARFGLLDQRCVLHWPTFTSLLVYL